MKEMFQYILGYFQASGEPGLKVICNCKVPSDIVLSAYSTIPPIESLPIKEKNELWEYAKETYPDGDTETRLRFTRITYTIGTLV